MSWLAGVDGGGTTTRAAVIDAAGRELGRANGRGAVATTRAPADAAAAVAAALRSAARAAGVQGRASVLWAGLAGAGQGSARDGVVAALREMKIAERVIVGTDVEAAFHDAFGDGPGVLLIAGTGSIAWARTPDGEVRRVGGWGALLGDEGSGYAIGLEGLRAVMRAVDGRAPSTSLTSTLPQAAGVAVPDDLVGWIEGASKGDVAALAPRVIGAADRGDPPASRIVAEAVAALVNHVRAAVSEPGTPVVPWGGLVADGGPLAGRLREALEAVGYPVSDRHVDPVRGATRLALAAAG